MTKRLTIEQQSVVNVDSGIKVLAVDAFAGTGKTSTLVAFAEARTNQKILYIAFNKAIATEAQQRFPNNVECRTTHSLAYGQVGRRYKDKLGDPKPYEIADRFNCRPGRAKHALKTVSAFLCSMSTEVTEEHVDRDAVGAENLREIGAVVELAASIWRQMQDENSPTKMPHDGYLKLWVMSKPKLRYDYILLDEAQDTNPVTLALVEAQRQHAKLVLVGDRHQGIYGFRKALNAMDLVRADQRIAITQSFRFAQGIADVATRLLQAFKGETNEVKGRADIEARWTVDRLAPYAILGRTNAGLFNEAARLASDSADGSLRLHFVGGFDSYMFGKVLDAYHLWMDQQDQIKDSMIGSFRTFSRFKAYGVEVGDPEVKALVKVVESYGARVPKIYDTIKAAEVPKERAQASLSTAHRGKGLEWQQVVLLDDFIELPPEDDDFDPEEINLLYVGVTRAIQALEMPNSLRNWLEFAVSEMTVASGMPPVEEARDGQQPVDQSPACIVEKMLTGVDGEVGDQLFNDTKDEAYELWLRNNLSWLSSDSQGHIKFLLKRLDEVRAKAKI